MQNIRNAPKQPSEAEMAQATLNLLRRVDLKGDEVPFFVQVHNWLQSKVPLNPGTIPTLADEDRPEAKDVN